MGTYNPPLAPEGEDVLHPPRITRGKFGRIQKTWPLAKRGCLIGVGVLILY